MLTTERTLEGPYVNGERVSSLSTASIPLVNPATEELLGSVPDGNDQDVDLAVRAAIAAQPGWQALSIRERAALLSALADRYESCLAEMAELVTLQNGSVISRSRRTNGSRPIAIYREYGRVGASLTEEETFTGDSRASLVRREPYGVVGAIVPWNAPQALLASKLGPALLAGCAVVVKPSPETTLDSFALMDMIRAVGIPPGVVNVVPGGRSTGAALVDHPMVDLISFTGSTKAGRDVAARCGRMLKPLTAELGGKSAAIILDDADLGVFSKALIDTCLPNTGQVCYSCTRLLAPRKRYQEVTDAVVDTLRASRIGDPFDPSTRFGPLVSAAQRDRVESYIESGRAEGARLLTGGQRPAGLRAGYYVEPTVFDEVHRGMRIFHEEIFGPVLVVTACDSDDDAVAIANDSSYGLGGSVFSSDIERATGLARRLETGSVLVNGQPHPTGVWPHGYKDSGVGDPDALDTYLRIKAISQPAVGVA